MPEKHPERWQVPERHNPIGCCMSFACQNRVQVLALSIEDSKKLIDDIELQNHWHTVLAHRATAPSPLLISTGFFVFFWGYCQIHKRCGHFQFLIVTDAEFAGIPNR